MEARDNPSTLSSEAKAMRDKLEQIADIRAGSEAIKSKSVKYLPRFVGENEETYKLRLEGAPWYAEFVDALQSMCGKPFTKKLQVQDPADQLKELIDDVDGEGNDLHEFARDVFESAVADGAHGIYVTFPSAGPVRTIAEEKARGNRPYWVPICLSEIIDLRRERRGGVDVLVHLRLCETRTERDGYSEKVREFVRELNLEAGDSGADVCTWKLHEKIKAQDGKEKWIESDAGTLSIGMIPLVLIVTGKRKGHFRVIPPLGDLATQQIDIYRAGARMEETLTFAGSPMLVGNGMDPPRGEKRRVTRADGSIYEEESQAPALVVGPKSFLYTGASPTAKFDYIQPNPDSLRVIGEDVTAKIERFRRHAKEPEMPGSAPSATGAAIDATKAHSAIEAWANTLADGLEQALSITMKWLGGDAAKAGDVVIHTDFAAEVAGSADYTNLIAMARDGRLSNRTLWMEGQRRGILGPQFDPDKEDKALAGEQQGLDPNGNPSSEPVIDPVTGLPIDQPPPGG